MGRAPCCEKMGLKRGPWTPEEDRILINYIQLYGHGNWRALPKQAGLLRCGKSCRLRWINYLRPDIKRGNFTREEEDTIIKLHEMLGNRWSAIAARLPGRTDNEIKNVWHTHLKKRLKQNDSTHCSGTITKQQQRRRGTVHLPDKFNQEESKADPDHHQSLNLSDNYNTTTESEEGTEYRPISPQQCSSDDTTSSVTTSDTTNNNMDMSSSYMKVEPSSNNDDNEFPDMDESFWSEVLSADNSRMGTDLPQVGSNPQLLLANSNLYDSMDFWYNLFTRAEELPELPDI
ncbi:hypothetical protein Tsubulata_011138 [Turnera subulata]|uniref:Uncharacterized protein n=1 Tax=Turnera subulata TaxID=218843 RepID=A0A9Q0FSK0_9ROSI|nr:hypothetical protein Tsubulata_011138 [Turnera subulata]